MIRTTDAAYINSLFERDFGEGDATALLENNLNVCLIDDDSGALFAWRGPGIYEIHLFFAVRGRAALNLFRDMIDAMRDLYGARLFWALIPVESRAVRMFARLTGFLSCGVIDAPGPNELFVSEKSLCLL